MGAQALVTLVDHPATAMNTGMQFLTTYNKFNENPNFLSDDMRIETTVSYCP